MLLHRGGDVYGVTPVCFDGTLSYRSTMASKVTFLKKCLAELRPPISSATLRSSRSNSTEDHANNDAQWRQIKASLLWTNDVFGDFSTLDRNVHYVSSRMNASLNTKSACLWPLKVQGPLVYSRLEIGVAGASSQPVNTIESFPSSRSYPLSLFAIGRQGQVDICALSSSLKFRFELLK